MTDTNSLWESGNEAQWQQALESYWSYVLPSHLALEQEMESLDASTVRALDAQGWYDFLLGKYFRWKYTAANRYATTTKHLKLQAEAAGLGVLLSIRDKIYAASEGEGRIRSALEAAKRIDGLGTAGASGLLAVLFPTKYGTADQFVVKALRKVTGFEEQKAVQEMKPEDLSVSDGVLLVRVMREKAADLNMRFGSGSWTPRKVDMVLWAVGHDC